MNSKLVFIYDNRNEINSSIGKIVALNTYGDIIYRRKRLKTIIQNAVLDIDSNIEFLKISSDKDVNRLINLLQYDGDKIYVNYFSSTVIINKEGVEVLLDKCAYINETMVVDKENPTMIVFNSFEQYKNFLLNDSLKEPKNIIAKYPNIKEIGTDKCLKNISVYTDFLKFFSGGFEARYFNSVQSDEYIVTKSSTNKKKMKAEHDYFYLLPENMKSWFVVPYDYKETENGAQYSMERIKTPDVALQWVHEAISLEDFKLLIDKIMFFVKSRNKKRIDKEKYFENMQKLYEQKVLDRIEQLTKMPEYEKLNQVIKLNTKYNSLEQIVEEYLKIYKEAISEYKFDFCEVIGHGDLCFSNMLYYKDIELIKFIDVKGATKEEELWMDPYYDLAKLSHSICGDYDFFNYDMVDVVIDNDLSLELRFEKRDTSKFVEIFKEKLIENGYNFRLVRIFELSLFLSMLPLHMDNRRKVLGFLMNSIRILEEIKNGK